MWERGYTLIPFQNSQTVQNLSHTCFQWFKVGIVYRCYYGYMNENWNFYAFNKFSNIYRQEVARPLSVGSSSIPLPQSRKTPPYQMLKGHFIRVFYGDFPKPQWQSYPPPLSRGSLVIVPPRNFLKRRLRHRKRSENLIIQSSWNGWRKFH